MTLQHHLTGYTTKCNLVIGITDTTGSMGVVLGKYLRDNGMEHAYCTGHHLMNSSLNTDLQSNTCFVQIRIFQAPTW